MAQHWKTAHFKSTHTKRPHWLLIVVERIVQTIETNKINALVGFIYQTIIDQYKT
jgi:cell shape-determining protein MreD